MRVKPPGDGPPPVAHVDETAPAAAPDSVAEARATEAVRGAAPTGESDAVAEVSRRLRAGEITAQQAVEMLVDDVVARHHSHLGAAPDRDRIAGELKQLLRKHAENDPYLASKVRRLGNRS